jgi:hypothetical protein
MLPLITSTDLMFERVSAPMDEKSYKKLPEFKKMQELYEKSIIAQKDQNPELSTSNKVKKCVFY